MRVVNKMVWICEQKTNRYTCGASEWNGVCDKNWREKPKKTAIGTFKHDTEYSSLTHDMTMDRDSGGIEIM